MDRSTKKAKTVGHMFSLRSGVSSSFLKLYVHFILAEEKECEKNIIIIPFCAAASRINNTCASIHIHQREQKQEFEG